MSNKKVFSIFTSIILIIILIFIDQFTKQLAVINLMNKDDYVLIPGVLQFHYLQNNGAAFSILEGKQALFAVITPILLLILIYILFKMPLNKKYNILNFIIIFIISGAIGNYIDRIRQQYVVDFIYFSLINFPVFNVADCYVTVALFLFLALMLFYYKDEDLEDIKLNLRFKKHG